MCCCLQVEAVRQARLEAQAHCFRLEQAQNELEHLRQHATVLEQQLQAQAVTAPCASMGPGCAADAALQEARLQAADERYARQLAELELAKQLDALGELQWQLECVVAQLGLQPKQVPPTAQHPAVPATTPCAIDHMLLLGKVEELRQAQLQIGEFKRRLARAEAQLQRQQDQQGQGACGPPSRTPGLAVPAELEGVGDPGSAACRATGHGSEPCEGQLLGEGGRQLVGELLSENEALRQQLAEAEVSRHRLRMLLGTTANLSPLNPCLWCGAPVVLRGADTAACVACSMRSPGCCLVSRPVAQPCRSGTPAWRGTTRWNCCSRQRHRRWLLLNQPAQQQ